MTILDGKELSLKTIEDIKKKVQDNNLNLQMAIIWIGNDESSSIYINNKIKKCEYVGIKTELYHLDNTISEEEVLDLIDSLNNRTDINAILLQSPVPNHINIKKCFNKIDYKKDIDGFSNISVGNLYLGNPSLVPCTAKGIIRLLKYYNISLEGKNVCIINRSIIVGKPLFHLLLQENATVTMCHSKTRNIKEITSRADIVICAVGIPNFLTADMIKENAIVIDVGISRLNGKVVGDASFDVIKEKCSYISPVPGGIGPMTVAMVLENILETMEW